ncbi:isochorismate synthase [Roseomonas elaeocarpi]|uniref:isochorismate synthase n=1 Tax=Roseomonas elaeocarpi TaxID=907779 RepID=A0ABV6JVZ9_9PROT
MSTANPMTGAARQGGAEAVLFRFRAPDGTVAGQGLRRVLPLGPANTLAERVARFFAENDGPPLLAGALPFDRAGADHLVQPQRLLSPEDEAAMPPAPTPARGRWQLRPEPPAARFAEAVREALAIMRDEAPDALRKVVLSRTLLAETDTAIDPDALLERLGSDPRVTAFRVPLPDGTDGNAAGPVLVGATPELLIRKRGEAVLSHPLAGSAPRQRDGAADRAAAEALRRSDKDHREHALVREFILDTLAPYCTELSTPDGTAITATATLWHLGTRITGRLRDPATSAAALAAALHPTPAVCGVPRAAAASLIPRLEGYDRGFYAGAVGWCDAAGDGCWYVTIRCAEIRGHRARLFAGAGIVPGSDPVSEVRETAAKFGALLRALAVPPEAMPEEAPEHFNELRMDSAARGADTAPGLSGNAR